MFMRTGDESISVDLWSLTDAFESEEGTWVQAVLQIDTDDFNRPTTTAYHVSFINRTIPSADSCFQ